MLLCGNDLSQPVLLRLSCEIDSVSLILRNRFCETDFAKSVLRTLFPKMHCDL